MTEILDKAVLCGYEAFAEFGFCLPLYKTNPSSNAWYIACSNKPYDLQSRISEFEQHFASDPQELSHRDHSERKVGTPYPIIFFWDNRPFIGSIKEIRSQLGASVRDLMKFAPMSMFDLALHSRQKKAVGHASNAFSSLRSRYTLEIAKKWLVQHGISQSIKLELDDRLIGREFAEEHASEMLEAIQRTRAHLMKPNIAEVLISDYIIDVVGDGFFVESDFATSYRISKCGRISIEIRTVRRGPITLASSPVLHGTSADEATFIESDIRKVKDHSTDPHINVIGKQIDVGPALFHNAQDLVLSTSSKYSNRIISADVTFSKVAGGYKCGIRLSSDHNLFVASGFSVDAYASLVMANQRLVKQMSKASDRAKKPQKGSKKQFPGIDEPSFVVVSSNAQQEVEDTESQPTVIADNPDDLPTLDWRTTNIAEQLRLIDAQFFVFRDAKNGDVMVAYMESRSIKLISLTSADRGSD